MKLPMGYSGGAHQGILERCNADPVNPTLISKYMSGFKLPPNAPEAWHQAHPEVSGESID
jgi:hypothetical protein